MTTVEVRPSGPLSVQLVEPASPRIVAWVQEASVTAYQAGAMGVARVDVHVPRGERVSPRQEVAILDGLKAIHRQGQADRIAAIRRAEEEAKARQASAARATAAEVERAKARAAAIEAKAEARFAALDEGRDRG